LALFPEPPRTGTFEGMTVNERLYAAGLLEKFDAASRARDRAGVIDLLKLVALSAQAASTADAMLGE
jgi:hypothetical protein